MDFTRQQAPCWTCKLRRKKCDNRTPVCGICADLEIACTAGAKPSWMDGAVQQRRMAETIAKTIRRNKERKRHRASGARGLLNDGKKGPYEFVSDLLVKSGNVLSIDAAKDVTKPSASEQRTTGGPSDTPSSDPNGGIAPPSRESKLDQNQRTALIETDFINKFLDFIFPALFPFYRPCIFETGRSWILHLLGRNKVAYHAIVSLSFYLFTTALTDADNVGGHADCKEKRWDDVHDQITKCFESIRAEISGLEEKSNACLATQMERVELLESIVLILIFESVLGKWMPWKTHLPAARALFRDIMRIGSEGNTEEDSFRTVLCSIDQPVYLPGQRNVTGTIWSPAQTGFRFCAGYLIFIDVVASAANGNVPELLTHHADVLSADDESPAISMVAGVRLSNMVGCPNEVIKAMAEISVLTAWKRKCMETDALSTTELQQRARSISDRLESIVSRLEKGPIDPSPSFIAFGNPFDTRSDIDTSRTIILIWTHAAWLYLLSIEIGWQLTNPEIRRHVFKIINLLSTVQKQHLRAIAWPICVAGCLASRDEEEMLRRLFIGLGTFHSAGALTDARQIMERIWEMRHVLDEDTWSLASCFGVLGEPVLLV